jgi:hypothetical protein
LVRGRKLAYRLKIYPAERLAPLPRQDWHQRNVSVCLTLCRDEPPKHSPLDKAAARYLAQKSERERQRLPSVWLDWPKS